MILSPVFLSLHISVEDEQRIIRSCGWLPNPESMRERQCFTRTGTHQVHRRHCLIECTDFGFLRLHFFQPNRFLNLSLSFNPIRDKQPQSYNSLNILRTYEILFLLICGYGDNILKVANPCWIFISGDGSSLCVSRRRMQWKLGIDGSHALITL